MNDSDIEKAVQQAETIAAGNYKEHEPTARNHARLYAIHIRINGELIKTIRGLDEKNSKLQRSVMWLSVVATVASVIALFK